MAQLNCQTPLDSRRRTFWTTQLDACGSAPGCKPNDICGQPGLSLITEVNGTTIANNDYVTGLILNILLTDARKEPTACGFTPGTRGGFWGDSFRDDGGYSGTSLRNIPTSYRINDAVALIRAYVTRDMQKLMTYGVATRVDVEARYIGNNTVDVVVSAAGQSGIVTKVGLKASRLKNAWVWNT